MHRKSFLGSLFASLAIRPLLGHAAIFESSMMTEEEFPRIIPRYLQPGDTIGITAPAGFIELSGIQSAIKKIQEWGFKVKIGATIGKKDFNFGGTDNERRDDLQQMLDDKNINAILCARGGYGIVRIIDQLDFANLKKHPKWIIGFSDVTILHNHIHHHFGMASIHSKMCNSFPDDWSLAETTQIKSIESIYDCLIGKKLQYESVLNPNNKKGNGSGVLIGGNLSIIESLAGTASDISTKNKILFLEETNEYLYSIDRMFWNLKRTGKLSHLKGLVIGGFKIKKDDEGEAFGKTLEQIVLEKTADYNYPICFDFPVGHQKYNMALKCGVVHTLNVTGNSAQLTSQN